MLYIIKPCDYSLSNYILESIEDRDDVAFIRYGRIKYHGINMIIQYVARYLRATFINMPGLWTEWFFSKEFLRQIKVIKQEDKVLFFSSENLKELTVLNTEINCSAKSVFIWNPLSGKNNNFYRRWKYKRGLHRTKMRICTFDTDDAKNYDFELVNQVFRYPAPEMIAEKLHVTNDVFFVCQDKKRSTLICEIIEEFNQQSITFDVSIIKNRHSRLKKTLLPYYTEGFVSYPDYCKRAMRSRCLLEILQKGQTGMTMRSLEAVFWGKKLITNNAEIRNSPIYHPNNIYILDGSESRSMKEFLDCDYMPLPDEIVAQYDIRTWIKQFL